MALNSFCNCVILGGMAEGKRDYEVTFIIDAEVNEETRRNLIGKVEGMIEKAGGEVLKKEEWGERELAYPIKKKKKGDYHFLQFKIDAGKLGELRGKLRREESILRYLFLKI